MLRWYCLITAHPIVFYTSRNNKKLINALQEQKTFYLSRSRFSITKRLPCCVWQYMQIKVKHSCWTAKEVEVNNWTICSLVLGQCSSSCWFSSVSDSIAIQSQCSQNIYIQNYNISDMKSNLLELASFLATLWMNQPVTHNPPMQANNQHRFIIPVETTNEFSPFEKLG